MPFVPALPPLVPRLPRLAAENPAELPFIPSAWAVCRGLPRFLLT